MYNLTKALILSVFLLQLPKANAMLRALNTAATGMAAQEMNVSTISNNIANVNTTGYKKQRTEIQDLLYETVTEAGSRSSVSTLNNVGVQIGSGAKVAGVRKEFSQGAPQITNNPFDLMINGEGFFGIVMPNNEVRYTRDGAFNVDSTGTLVNKQGYKLYPSFVFPPGVKSVNIAQDGSMEAYMSNQVEPVNLGQVPIFTFINPIGLKSTGMNLYAMTKSSGQAIQNIAGENSSGSINQGQLEGSNVSIMNEMTSLIKAQRAYEMNSKVMGVADQMLQTVNNIR
ncbi:flagellar basal-body rod protein FlgG [Halobacteriovorax sp. HLS]|uniref:flagellar basal-body rod protein FlgG n=1 Tax=Halobacteriovorax sp. HLS TaxID=2234000 RepID=UPI001F4E2C1C|nr:flagellar basal-body rod protein FlgG [Halobacteriovorax sp. HLS]